MRWEYKSISIESRIGTDTSIELMTKAFNELGNQGWELVQVMYDNERLNGQKMAVFKRPRS